MKFTLLIILTLILFACGGSTSEQNHSKEATQEEDTPRAKEDKQTNTFDFDSTKVLDYDVNYGNDISYAGNSRATVRVMLNVSEIPTEEEIKMTSYKIFKENTEGWNEVTIWTYLPGMDIKSTAYGIFEINDQGEVKFFTNEAGLIGTKWYEEN